MKQFRFQLESDVQAVEKRLSEVLGDKKNTGELYRPKKLMDAMRHATLNGGKRLRPFLVLQAGKLFGAKPDNLLQIATALECVHCYSLVHDDLPAMDDDDLRRGEPTVHKKFDEATAILAGDALLTFAFDLLADQRAHDSPLIRIQLVSKLAKAAGIGGMAGGQMLDLQPESSMPVPKEISLMQAMKTGALIKYACEAGGICGGATDIEMSALETYGSCIGQAFQLADDILDVTATSGQMGKTTAKDENKGKQTQVSNLGISSTRKIADDLVSEAADALAIFGDRAGLLIDAAQFTVRREK